MKNWKYILIVLSLMSAGFYAAWYVQGIRVEYVKSEIRNLKSQIEKCQDTNTMNQETIGKLKNEVEDTQNLCESRLRKKDTIITRLRRIDALKSESPKDNFKEKETEKETENENDIINDTILHELNRLFGETDSKD